MSLQEVCEKAVENGQAKTVIGSAIQVVIQADPVKFRQVEESYGKAIECAFQKRKKQETAAWRKLLREGLYFWASLCRD